MGGLGFTVGGLGVRVGGLRFGVGLLDLTNGPFWECALSCTPNSSGKP